MHDCWPDSNIGVTATDEGVSPRRNSAGSDKLVGSAVVRDALRDCKISKSLHDFSTLSQQSVTAFKTTTTNIYNNKPANYNSFWRRPVWTHKDSQTGLCRPCSSQYLSSLQCWQEHWTLSRKAYTIPKFVGPMMSLPSSRLTSWNLGENLDMW